MKRGPSPVLGPPALEMVAARFRLLGEPSRLRLLVALQQGPRTVSDLVRLTGMTQTNVSRHLRALTDGGILQRRRQGTRVVYSVADRSIFELCDLVCGSLRQRLAQQSRALPAGRR